MEDRLTSAYYQSPVGTIRVSGTGQYITEVHFLDENAAGPENLEEQPGPLVIECVEQLIRYFQGDLRQFEVPVHQSGSQFQTKVWNELSCIPYGRTISYLELSRRIGDVKAIRAVAAANGRNHVAIIVPCHRVIGSDRTLTGYAGGLWRKKWLLDHEAKHVFGVQTLF